jgi:hypothetical protein
MDVKVWGRAFITLVVLSNLSNVQAVPASPNADSAQKDNIEELLQKRKAIAESGEFIYQSKFVNESLLFQAAATAASLAEAIDVDPSILVDVAISGPSEASAVFKKLGVIQPRRGPTFALLSSGIAGTSEPQPGVDFTPVGTSGDKVILTLHLNLPAGVNRLSFIYNFLSVEFPEYQGSIFNDTFTATLTDSHGIREIARASVNGSSFFPVSASRAGGSGFDIFTESGSPDAGLTGFRLVTASVAGGGPVTLKFSIEDKGDGILV